MIRIRPISGFLFIFLSGLALSLLWGAASGASAQPPYPSSLLLSWALRLGVLCLGCLLPLTNPGFIPKFLSIVSDRKKKLLFLVSGVIAIDILARLTTPQIAFGTGLLGPGYGHDGAVYGWMTEHFAWFEHSVQAPFNGRILMPWLVHLSGLPAFSGYRLFNGLFYFANAWLVFQLMRFYKVHTAVCSAAVLLFCLVRFYEKFSIYYPVLTDMAGLFFLLAGINTALRKKTLLFTLTLSLGVFCRENLLALLPFFLICVCRSDAPRGSKLKTGAFVLLPLLIFALLRAFPVFKPAEPGSITAALSFLTGYFQEPRRWLAFLLAHGNTLGVLFFFPLLLFRQSLNFFRHHPEWLYYGGVTLLLSLAGGMDYDRFAVWQAPLGLVLIAASTEKFSFAFWGAALWVQFLMTEIWNPWRPDEMFYLSRYSWFPHSQTLERLFSLPDSFDYQAAAAVFFLFSLAASFLPLRLPSEAKAENKMS